MPHKHAHTLSLSSVVVIVCVNYILLHTFRHFSWPFWQVCPRVWVDSRWPLHHSNA